MQTRPFRIAEPETYTSYRLVVTETTGAANANLAEVELLTDGSKAQTTGVKVVGAPEFEVTEDTEWTGTVATFSGGVGYPSGPVTARAPMARSWLEISAPSPSRAPTPGPSPAITSPE